MLHDAVNDSLSSFQWRFDMFSTGVLTEGRFVTYIERNDRGQPINLFPVPKCTVKRLPNGRKEYTHQAGGKTVVYDEAEGYPHAGIAPGTRWADVPDTFECPDCEAKKADFEMIEF